MVSYRYVRCTHSDHFIASLSHLQNTIGSRALLGNQAMSVLRDAAQEVIATLKDENLLDCERHDAISKLLTGKSVKSGKGISSEQYATFVQMGKALDDYQTQTQNEQQQQDTMDDEMGVAVVFDDSEEENEQDSDINEDQGVDVAPLPISHQASCCFCFVHIYPDDKETLNSCPCHCCCCQRCVSSLASVQQSDHSVAIFFSACLVSSGVFAEIQVPCPNNKKCFTHCQHNG